MVDLRALAGAELRWVRTGFLPAAFALFHDDTELGSVAWENLFSSRAILRTDAGEWRVHRKGLGHLVIEDAASGGVVAAMRLHLFGSGELAFADGRTVAFRRTALLPPAWSFFDGTDAGGSELLSVRGRVAALFRGGSARIEPAAAAMPEAGLLTLLGIYILVRRARRRARH
ncbi:MAG TPA: hypothetical protein VF832_10800 [Longimicrobiales bacterium]